MTELISSCRVVVKFREAGSGVPAMTIGACMQELLPAFPHISAGRLFSSVPSDTIRAWVNKATTLDPGYHAPDFSTFYGIGCTDEKQAEALAQQLSAHEAVELSYVENGFSQFVPGHPNGTSHNRQGYLLPAPEGIDVSYAWQLAGGQGEGGVRFIDIEQGWLPHHEAVTVNLLPCTGISNSQAAGHGTAVLGILTLQPNQAGAIGIVPRAQGHVLSQWRPNGAFNTADAIMTAIGYLKEGDILLIEAQTHHSVTAAKTWPVEIHEASFQAIRLAVAMGIIVIEPAGNGSTDAPAGNDLDKFTDHNGHNVLNPLSDHFRDSGAIMVAAASHTVPHVRSAYSNYGRRVNCYAWGESVLTAGSHPRSSGNAINTYTNTFGGTSAASAIVAGAAIALQSIAESGHRFRLNPRQMRSLLGDEEYGTPSAGGRWEDKIGVMPDLQKMIREALLIVPTLRSPGKLL